MLNKQHKNVSYRRNVLMILMTFILAVILICAGCGMSRDSVVDEELAGNYLYENSVMESNLAMSEESFGTKSTAVKDGISPEPAESSMEMPQNAKIIRRASLDLESTEFDDTVEALKALVKEMGAYFEWSDISKNSGQYRYGNFTVRVDSKKMDSFLEKASGICNVVRREESAEDVSEHYYDTESRLNTAKTKLERLQNLLKSAATMQDIIELENAISDTEQQIDNLTGTLKHYDSLVGYATVNLTVSEVYRTSDKVLPATFGERISKAFYTGCKGFAGFLEGIVLFFAQAWIWILVVAAIVLIVLRIVLGKKRKAKAGVPEDTEPKETADRAEATEEK